MSKKTTRTARRFSESPRAAVAAADTKPPAAVDDKPPAATPADSPEKKVAKLALMYDTDNGVFLVDRMERSTVERFRQMARATPELFGAGEGSDVEFDLDLDAWITQAYGLLFGGAGMLLVRSGRMEAARLPAFQNVERIKKLVPQTERAIDEQFGAKIRNLPPLVQLGLSIVAVAGAMYQDAAQMPIDDAGAAPRGGPRALRPGDEVH